MNLEEEKLELEIKELKRSSYWKPEYLKIYLTLAFLVFTLVIAYKTGILDLKSENLKLERNRLVLEIADFEKEKIEVQNQIRALKDSLKNISQINHITQKQLLESYKKHEKLLIEKFRSENRTEEIISYYKNKLDSLRSSIVKIQSADKALTDQDGNILTDQDGNALIVR